MNRKVVFFVFFLIIWFSSQQSAECYGLLGKVVKVKDGDTVVIAPADSGQFFTCRLYGIDAPEIRHKGKPGQPYGVEASRYLKNLILGRDVVVRTTGRKTYGREICQIEYEGDDINLEMVKAGYAWAYRRYLKRPYVSEYIEAEREARRHKRGLWGEPNPTPPWVWRKLKYHAIFK